MHISVFCGASLPHSEQITEAARQLGRAIARGGHTLLYGGSNLGADGRHQRRGPTGRRPRGGRHPHLLQRRHHPLAARQRL